MKRFILLSCLLFPVFSLIGQALQTPQQFFGFRPGEDRKLFTYEKMVEYLQVLDKGSDRLQMFKIGESPMGKPMYAACFSAPQNLKNLDALKQINRTLALDATLSEAELTKSVQDGKVFVLATMSMHSSEVAPSQSVPLIAYDWITTTDESVLQAMEKVVFMIVPCHNPDGMDMVVEDYLKYVGTIYEGSPLPGLYHKYVGHDNNRDFIILSQSDTRAISALTSTDWFPQVMVEKHQMGSDGPRYFVPPNHDPIAENVDASLFIWDGIFGQEMISSMTAVGLKGVSQHAMFDNYWPGSTETC
ncbi:MAG: M14 family zinc carboxypeptidase, partial [Bacteroidota bacterium]